MAEPMNQAAVPTLQNTLPPELETSIKQAAAGLPPEAVQQALGVYGAFTPTLGEQAALRAGMTAPSGATTLEQQAQAALQQASSAPVPQVSGARQGLNELLGSVASIMSGNQAYRQTAAQRLQKEQEDLLESRRENLTNLKNIYDQRAAAAKSMGNAIAEEENRIKRDRLDKTLESINKSKAAAEEMRQIGAKAAAERATAKAAEPIAGLDKEIRTYQTIGGEAVQFIDTSAYTPTDAAKIRQQLADTKTLVLNKNDAQTFSKLNDTRANIDSMVSIVQQLPSDYKGIMGVKERVQRGAATTAARYGLGDPKLVKLVADMGALRSTAIQMVQAFASLGSGLRINQAEINSVLTTDYPTPDDTRAQAITKLQRLRTILGHVEESALLGRGGVGGAYEEIKPIPDNIGMVDTKKMQMLVRIRKITKDMPKGFKVGQLVWKDIADNDLNSGAFDTSLKGGK